MKIKLTSDSTIDLSKDIVNKLNISIIGLNVLLGSDEYIDGENIDNQLIFDYVAKSGVLPKTSAKNSEEFKEFFSKFTKQGYKVIHFSVGAKLSVSYRCAKTASEELEGVTVIDGNTLSTGTALLLLYANDLINEGKSYEEIINLVNNRVPYVQASFVIDNLKYLHKGGRCSAVAMFGANLLRIKPSIRVDNGNLVVGKKYRGNYVKVLENYVEDTLNDFNHPDYKRVFVTYANATSEMIDAVTDKLKELASFGEIICTTTGSTITSHCGPLTLGIMYINDKNLQ